MDGFEVVQHMSLKWLNYHRDQGNGSVFIKSCVSCFFGDKGDGGFEAGWHMACLSEVLKLSC